MVSDIEMSDMREIPEEQSRGPSYSPSPVPPTSTSSRKSSLSIHDSNIPQKRDLLPKDVIELSDTDDQKLSSLPPPRSKSTSHAANLVGASGSSSSGKPPSTAATAAAAAGAAAATHKPKSTKSARPRSLSPPPQPPRPPLETIRLEIKLGGPDNYEVDIAQVTRAAGLRPPTPPVRVHKRDTSDSEGDDEDDGKRRHKRRVSRPFRSLLMSFYICHVHLEEE